MNGKRKCRLDLQTRIDILNLIEFLTELKATSRVVHFPELQTQGLTGFFKITFHDFEIVLISHFIYILWACLNFRVKKAKIANLTVNFISRKSTLKTSHESYLEVNVRSFFRDLLLIESSLQRLIVQRTASSSI